MCAGDVVPCVEVKAFFCSQFFRFANLDRSSWKGSFNAELLVGQNDKTVLPIFRIFAFKEISDLIDERPAAWIMQSYQ